MSGGFKDHFSAHAADYAAYRPGYPGALYDWLAQAAPARWLAWDCATGNGQAAVELARRFTRVFASDASAEQLRHAQRADNIEFRVEPAERASLADRSVDLVTVAQAYHWFDHAAFVAECGRVCAPGGLVAIWCYALARVSPAVDAVVGSLYRGEVGPYWPPERRLVETGYRELTFPWPEVRPPPFSMILTWTLAEFEGYLRTWSAVQRYLAARGADPVAALHPALAAAWSDEAAGPRRVEWPIALRAFRLA
jgi:SAM-dependent methyltransferase